MPAPPMCSSLLKPFCEGELLAAGVDEAGRGPLAGPVVAAAVILNADKPISGLADSKKLSPQRRQALSEEIQAKALYCSVALASVQEIDALNILHASMLAMRRAVNSLLILPTQILVDGNRVPKGLQAPAQAIVGGDASVAAISAASILAKVARDALCQELDTRYPVYGFAQHKGYGTRQHLAMLQLHGPSNVHRQSFAPVHAARRLHSNFA